MNINLLTILPLTILLLITVQLVTIIMNMGIKALSNEVPLVGQEKK
jgi:hypothetical protein